MMLRFMCIAVAFLAIPWRLAGGDDAAMQKALKALEGSWQAVAGVEDGQEIPKEKLPRITYVLHADGMITGQTRDGETLARMTVHPGNDPKRVDFLLESGAKKGAKQYAIYKLKGDKLSICMAPPGNPEVDRPRDFAAKVVNVKLLVFERVKGEKKQ
jgi:uncharacterized protein (TIGR03067 family)